MLLQLSDYKSIWGCQYCTKALMGDGWSDLGAVYYVRTVQRAGGWWKCRFLSVRSTWTAPSPFSCDLMYSERVAILLVIFILESGSLCIAFDSEGHYLQNK